MNPQLVCVRPHAQTSMPEGISERTAPTCSLALVRGVIPPGVRGEAHVHLGFDAAIHVLSGRLQSWYGPGLLHTLTAEAGDYLYIPAGLPHQPQNLSDREPVVALIARTAVGVEEPVAPYHLDRRPERAQLEQLYAALACDDAARVHALLHPDVRHACEDGSAVAGRTAVIDALRGALPTGATLAFELDALLRVVVRTRAVSGEPDRAHAFELEGGLVRTVCALSVV